MKTRRPIIAGNWKMYKTNREAIELANGLRRALSDIEEVEVVLCPPFTALSDVAEVLLDSNIKLGAQNMHWDEEGAYTGEISAPMLKSLGAEFVILGHSERRQYFRETDETVNKKIKTALKFGLTPIVCIGETLDERERGETFSIVEKQFSGLLKDISASSLEKLVFAYEPVWAIGTGKTATSAQAEEVHAFLRKLLEKWYNKEISQSIRILYGGSVKPDNSRELISQEDIDGALVGGASLNLKDFSEIIKKCLDS
ncbi:MAG: triose-phosphate isomerase [Candidatus Omnitrophota bacterium]